MPRDIAWTREVFKPSRDVIKGLRRCPDAAMPLVNFAKPLPSASRKAKHTRVVLPNLVLESVIPELVAQLASTPLEQRTPPIEHIAHELARSTCKPISPSCLM